jgi:hypothetical protein
MLLAIAETSGHTDEVSSGFGAGQGRSKLSRPLLRHGWSRRPDHGRAGPTVTTQTGGAARTAF